MMSSKAQRMIERTIGIAIVLMILLVITASLLPVSRSRPYGRRDQCRNNLKQIGLALFNYHEVWGSFPPAYIPDESGQPKHSWRTLILPNLDQAPLYYKYSLSESWDGPNNSALRATNLPVYTCPSDPVTRPGRTNYVAVVGPNTAWTGAQPSNLKDSFPRGAANAILVVEVADSGIDWIEPRDLEFDEITLRLNGAERNSISSRHQSKGDWPWSREVHVVNVLFADGHIESLPLDTPPEKIRTLLTTNDVVPEKNHE